MASAGDEEKRLGNEAFVEKKFDEAMTHYNAAINIDPENAVYYSNRSACYGAKLMWKEAAEDAERCIEKDSTFIKGYHRLAAAQTEQKQFDDAISTLTVGLTKDTGNELLTKQLKSVRAKKTLAQRALSQPKKQLTENQKKEAMELQEQLMSYNRDLKGVQQRIQVSQRDTKATHFTNAQIDSLEGGIPLYRTVGKAFILTPRDEVKVHLDKEQETHTKNLKDLMDRQEYLERRVASTTSNLKDLFQGM